MGIESVHESPYTLLGMRGSPRLDPMIYRYHVHLRQDMPWHYTAIHSEDR